MLSGSGDVIEPDEGLAAIGSGGGFAFAAAKAFLDQEELSAPEIVERSIRIAASICVYTNENVIVEKL